MTRLEAFRKARKWTYGQLGDVLQRAASQCQRYCKGESQPRPPVAAKISEISHGLIHAGNYADEISETEAAAMMAEIAALAEAAA